MTCPYGDGTIPLEDAVPRMTGISDGDGLSGADIKDSGFDDAGTALPFAGKSQAQLTVDLPTDNRDCRNCVGKRDGRPAIGFPDPQFGHQFFFSRQAVSALWLVSEPFCVSLGAGGDHEYDSTFLRGV